MAGYDTDEQVAITRAHHDAHTYDWVLTALTHPDVETVIAAAAPALDEQARERIAGTVMDRLRDSLPAELQTVIDTAVTRHVRTELAASTSPVARAVDAA